DERVHVERGQLWRRELGQPRVRAHESTQGFGAGGDDAEAALDVVAPVGGRRIALDDRGQTAGNRFDGRQRVVHLVGDDADQSLPRLALFFAEWLAQMGEDEQFMRPAALAERAAADLPAADAAGKGRVDDARRLAGEAVLQAELVGAPPEHSLRRL